jgi:uncharacterized membrane protein YcaP (DUF421 family)
MQILFFRTLLLYIVVAAALRLMGKRQVGELQPSELVIAMMISELASIPLADAGAPMVNILVPIVTLTIAEAVFSFLALKMKFVRKLISGQPTALVQRGEIMEDALRRLRYSLDDLMEELRIGGYANVADVEFAILETNGKLSIIPKSSKRPATPRDMNLSVPSESAPFFLVSDGKPDRKAIAASGISEARLKEMLAPYGASDYAAVFAASLDSEGVLFVQLKRTAKGARK